MKINLEYDNCATSPALVDYVEQKVNKLDRYFDKIVQADVLLKNDPGKKTDQNMCDIRLNVPNDTLFADASGETIQKAISEATENITRQLKKYKEKLSTY